MANTDISICNAALTRIGEDPITSLTDGSAASIIASANYEVTRQATLGEHPWNFAKKKLALNQVDETPELPWTESWQLPSGILLLRTLQENGEPVDYELMGGKVLTEGSSEPVAIYTEDKAVVTWPPYAVELLTQRMTVIFASGVTEKAGLVDIWMRSAENYKRLAKSLDAQSQTAAAVPAGSLRSRRG